MTDTVNLGSEGGRIAKMEVDYTATCDDKIPECKKMAAEGKLHDALDILLALEKQTRTVSFCVLKVDLYNIFNVYYL